MNTLTHLPLDKMAAILRTKHTWFQALHHNDVIMTTVASQITSLTVVYSTVYSDADQRKHQSSASLAFVRGIHRDRCIPRTKGQLRGKCFHLMTSSCGSQQTWKTKDAFCNKNIDTTKSECLNSGVKHIHLQSCKIHPMVSLLERTVCFDNGGKIGGMHESVVNSSRPGDAYMPL